ncbi:nucleotidyltransferase substrate binding protein [Marinomonas sp.]|uniref:nucleotidyltransferase substrate binding protein n=1 Tax=Marinomonas sp. TaxID=1904862 RepID=UPI003BA86A7C
MQGWEGVARPEPHPNLPLGREKGKGLEKDYQEEGFSITSPRDAIKTAFQYQLIGNGKEWLEALSDRNLTEHTYQEETAQLVELKIKSTYYPILKDFHRNFTQRLTK